MWKSWKSSFGGNICWGATWRRSKGKTSWWEPGNGFEQSDVWPEAKRKAGQGRGLARQRGVWCRLKTNSLGASTDEILKIRSSWKERPWTWCDQRSVKELKCLGENEVKVSTCLDAETGCWGGEDTSLGRCKKGSGTANKKEMERNKHSEGK